MAKRKKHFNAEIEAAIQSAELQGWTIKLSQRGHAWGQMLCPFNDTACRCGQYCRRSIWSTPRNATNHAKQIRNAVDKCIRLNQPEQNE